MRCADCQWKYPDVLLSELMTNEGYTDPICGICALEATNVISGIARKEFRGESAEALRQSAIRWRKNHPYDAPKVM